MNNLIIEKTDSTPGVILDYAKNHIEFNGDSRPENVKSFFEPIFDWISEYNNYLNTTQVATSEIKLDVNFKLEYFNSSSAKYIIDLVRTLNKIGTENNKVKVSLNWCHDEDDEDMLDTGKEFVRITGVSMNFIAA